jgi:hypothetical protein
MKFEYNKYFKNKSFDKFFHMKHFDVNSALTLFFAAVMLFLIGIVIKAIITTWRQMNIANNNRREGMKGGMKEGIDGTDEELIGIGSKLKPSEISDNMKDNTSSIQDALLVDKYRKDYENTIIHTNDWVDTKILHSVVTGAVDPMATDDANMASIEKINHLVSFKKTLNNSMKHLDSMKTNNTGGLW